AGHLALPPNRRRPHTQSAEAYRTTPDLPNWQNTAVAPSFGLSSVCRPLSKPPILLVRLVFNACIIASPQSAWQHANPATPGPEPLDSRKAKKLSAPPFLKPAGKAL